MTVVFYGIITEYTNGIKSYSPALCPDLRSLIDKLGTDYGGSFRDFLLGDETCLFLINGTGAMNTGGLDSPLIEGDKIEILPFVDAG